MMDEVLVGTVQSLIRNALAERPQGMTRKAIATEVVVDARKLGIDIGELEVADALKRLLIRGRGVEMRRNPKGADRYFAAEVVS